MSDRWHLSPYCVLNPSADGRTITLLNARYGSRFELSLDLLQVLGRVLAGTPLETAAGEDPGLREALEEMVTEKVLIGQAELEAMREEGPFRNRLTAFELAVHRGFNEGGYFPEGIDPDHRPEAFSVPLGTRAVPLETYALEPFPGLLECLEARQSIRSYSDAPLELEALERFLQMTLRAHAVFDVPPLGPISLRNYPSGGARYPLEVYPVIYEVRGLEPGIYRYHPLHHRLEAVESEALHRDRLRAITRAKMGDPRQLRGQPAILLLITAVFARTCWKYVGIPYQVILQEVGALYQTMYLAATSLGLAPCAIGAFPERAVAEILGLDSRDEAQVGLFALGAPESAAEPAAHVRDVRLRQGSPFSPEPGRRSVELHLANGITETQDLDGLQLEDGPDDRTRCPLLRGRLQGLLEPEAAARLREWKARNPS